MGFPNRKRSESIRKTRSSFEFVKTVARTASHDLAKKQVLGTGWGVAWILGDLPAAPVNGATLAGGGFSEVRLPACILLPFVYGTESSAVLERPVFQSGYQR